MVIVESIFRVPEPKSIWHLINGVRNAGEMLQKFDGHVFVGRVCQSKLQGDVQHHNRIQSHPSCSVRLVMKEEGSFSRCRAPENLGVFFRWKRFSIFVEKLWSQEVWWWWVRTGKEESYRSYRVITRNRILFLSGVAVRCSWEGRYLGFGAAGLHVRDE